MQVRHMAGKMSPTPPSSDFDINYRLTFTDREAELLLAFETHSSLDALSKKYSRDITVISRTLKRIASKADVLDKIGGRWRLTDLGRRLNQLTQDFI